MHDTCLKVYVWLQEGAPAVASAPVAMASLSGVHVVLPLRKRAAFAGQDVLQV